MRSKAKLLIIQRASKSRLLAPYLLIDFLPSYQLSTILAEKLTSCGKRLSQRLGTQGFDHVGTGS